MIPQASHDVVDPSEFDEEINQLLANPPNVKIDLQDYDTLLRELEPDKETYGVQETIHSNNDPERVGIQINEKPFNIYQNQIIIIESNITTLTSVSRRADVNCRLEELPKISFKYSGKLHHLCLRHCEKSSWYSDTEYPVLQ
ncbi:hypothetical protein GWI33_002362 [Rhynchophorus ferrugineus]|uniref:Uncharacterized protein n=1 Tax=Rhynchophorus ferrugineus TaxID=354439 RepID=A0A834IKF7_RHYFE|nr:hypothetical protein GWI33_002362 [Rhynchophorus ferrugineus]